MQVTHCFLKILISSRSSGFFYVHGLSRPEGKN